MKPRLDSDSKKKGTYTTAAKRKTKGKPWVNGPKSDKGDWWVQALEDERNANKAKYGATVGKDDRRSKEKMYEQQDRVASVMGLSGLALRHFVQRRRGKK